VSGFHYCGSASCQLSGLLENRTAPTSSTRCYTDTVSSSARLSSAVSSQQHRDDEQLCTSILSVLVLLFAQGTQVRENEGEDFLLHPTASETMVTGTGLLIDITQNKGAGGLRLRFTPPTLALPRVICPQTAHGRASGLAQRIHSRQHWPGVAVLRPASVPIRPHAGRRDFNYRMEGTRQAGVDSLEGYVFPLHMNYCD
jgi:hypothetical protein